jgi:hypothetical protein
VSLTGDEEKIDLFTPIKRRDLTPFRKELPADLNQSGQVESLQRHGHNTHIPFSLKIYTGVVK